MINHIRGSLAWKLFIAFGVILLFGMIISGSAIEWLLPSIFNRHMAGSSMMMGNSMMGQNEGMNILDDFRAIATEAILIAGSLGLILAGAAAWFISREFMKPIHAMQMMADQVIAGNYDQRIPIQTPQNRRDELEKMAIHLNSMAETLHQTEQRRQQLIGDVAHELRTPLTVIGGTMEGIIDGVIPAETETFEKIKKESERLNKLVNDLRDLSAMEADQPAMMVAPVDLGIFLGKAVEHFAHLFEEKDIQVSLTTIPKNIKVLGDEDRLMQVLSNILANALHYTPTGGVVAVTLEERNDLALLQIRDSGIGIVPEHLPFIFDRFYRADRSRARNSGGSGIGLTIAKRIIERHGGRIWIESAGEGQGSTVSIELPIQFPFSRKQP